VVAPGLSRTALVVGIGAVVALLIAAAGTDPLRGLILSGGVLGLVAVTLGAATYIGRTIHPAAAFSAALVLAIFAGNWDYVGIPGAIGPERLVFLAALVAVAFRAPRIADRAKVEVRPVHWMMLLLILYAFGSALWVGSWLDRGAMFDLLQNLGALPFAVFLLAPAAFVGRHERGLLITVLVALGGYLGVIALLNGVGLRGLVFPHYIVDPTLGPRIERARGPFLEPVTMGFALYACGVACVIALQQYQRRSARVATAAVLVLCGVGLLLTLQRSVWVATIVAVVITMASAPELRRRLVATVVGLALLLAVALLTIPGLSDLAEQRSKQAGTVYERENLVTAAVNMVEARPLLGFGWNQFVPASAEYFRIQPDIPLQGAGIDVHTSFLGYAADLGLVGVTAWIAIVLWGIGGALLRRPFAGAPDGAAWQRGLLSITTFFVIVANFVPLQAFASYVLWLWAAVTVAATRSRFGDEPASSESLSVR
jgi:putative inorganic carbon (HCO3(-)) transporter